MSSQLLHDLVRRHALSPPQARALWQCAHPAPAAWPALLLRALALVAALLLGAGLIFWVAAHWPTQTRSFKLHLLQAAVLLPGVLAMFLARARTALLLLALLALGGLLAFVGQTYQTGADAWQLFAAWAALSLPWLLLARSDGLWAAWLLIAAAALALWSGESLLDPLGLVRRSPHYVQTLLYWLPVWGWPFLLPHLRWCAVAQPRISRVMAALLALAAWSGQGLWGLFWSEQASLYLLAGALVLLALLVAWRQRALMVFTLGLLAANTLFLAGCWRVLWPVIGRDFISIFWLLALLAAVSIGLSVRWLHRLQKGTRGEAA